MEAAMFDDSLCFPPLPADLDDLFSDDLMAFLKTADLMPEPAAPGVAAACCAPGHLLSGLANNCVAPVPSTSAGSRAPSPPLPPAATGTVTSLAQRPVSNKPATSQAKSAAGVKRTVTTELPPSQQHSKKAAVGAITPAPVLAPVPPITQTTVPAPPPVMAPPQVPAAPAKPSSAQHQQQHHEEVDSRSGSMSDDSADTEEDMEHDGQQKAVNRRKAPEIDWKSITDPAERRRQRRLAKNRVTAARSRERKKAQWAELEEKLNGLESENHHLKALLEKFSRENSQLRDQLAQVTCGVNPHLKGSNAEPAVLIFIATLLVLACFTPSGDRLALLGSVLPLILSAGVLKDYDFKQPLGDLLIRCLIALKTLVHKSGRAMRASMHKLLYQRHYFVGRKALQKLGTVAAGFDPLGIVKIKVEAIVS